MWRNKVSQLSTVAVVFCSDPLLDSNIKMLHCLRGFGADLSKEGARIHRLIR